MIFLKVCKVVNLASSPKLLICEDHPTAGLIFFLESLANNARRMNHLDRGQQFALKSQTTARVWETWVPTYGEVNTFPTIRRTYGADL